MFRNSLLLVLIFIIGQETHAQVNEYNAYAIPAELKENANSVIRKDLLDVDVNKSGFISKRTTATTYFNNEHFDDDRDIAIYYDTERSLLNEVTVNVFDKNGILVRKYSKRQLEDYPAHGSSVYSTGRKKEIYIEYSNFPLTIEIKEKRTITNLFGIQPVFFYHYGEEQSIQKGEYSFEFDISEPLRFKVKNIKLMPQETKISNTRIKKVFSINNLKALEFPYFSGSFKNVVPHILVSPTQLKWDEYSGEFNNWKDFGLFMNKLMAGRQDLSEEQIELAMKSIEGLTNDYDKAKALYQYMQNKTRYVSIQMGIGGFQPFPATSVEKNGYGECKALSNYTKNLLNAAGIKAHYVLVNSEGRDIKDKLDFPSAFSFDHATLAIEVNQDTLYLECTSQNKKFGYNGTFTSDRDVLWLTEEGGKVVHSNEYDHKDNFQNTETEIEIQEDGIAKINVTLSSGSLMNEWNKIEYYHNKSVTVQKKNLVKLLRPSNVKVDSIQYSYEGDHHPTGKIKGNFNSKNFGIKTGNRIFVKPLIFKNQVYRLGKEDEKRKIPVYVKYGKSFNDEIIITFPPGMTIESTPTDTKFENQFGSYQIKYEQIDFRTIKVLRSSVVKSGEFPSESYEELRLYYKRIKKEDKKPIVLIKKS